MQTSNDIKTFLYTYIKESELYSAICGKGGGLYKTERPLNSKKMDCVIRILTMVNGVYGKATAYLNIYVRDIQTDDNTFIEDTITTAYFEKAIANEFDKYKCCTDVYRVFLEDMVVLNIDETKEHCVNAKLSIDIVNY